MLLRQRDFAWAGLQDLMRDNVHRDLYPAEAARWDAGFARLAELDEKIRTWSRTAAEPAVEVTGLGDPVRTFIPAARDLTPVEAEAFRRALRAGGIFPATGARDPAAEIRAAIDGAAPPECRSCGLDDLPVDARGRCRYCVVLEECLREERDLAAAPSPESPFRWLHSPAACLTAALAVIVFWVILYVISKG